MNAAGDVFVARANIAGHRRKRLRRKAESELVRISRFPKKSRLLLNSAHSTKFNPWAKAFGVSKMCVEIFLEGFYDPPYLRKVFPRSDGHFWNEKFIQLLMAQKMQEKTDGNGMIWSPFWARNFEIFCSSLTILHVAGKSRVIKFKNTTISWVQSHYFFRARPEKMHTGGVNRGTFSTRKIDFG